MKALILSVVMLGLVGCSSWPKFLDSTKNQIEVILADAAEGTYVVTIVKDEKVIYTETWDCVKNPNTGKLSGCDKRSDK